MKQPIKRETLVIPLYRTERTETPGAVPGYPHVKVDSRVPNGTRTGDVELRIDVEKILIRLGEKALRAKSKRATGLSGAIEVVALSATIKDEGRTDPKPPART